MLYELKDPGSDKVHYLFGTMHVRNKDAYTFVEAASPYIEASEIYAAEMDLDAAENINIMQYFFLPEGKHIRSYYAPQKYKKMRKMILKAYDIDLDNIGNFLPLFIGNMLGEKVLTDEEQYPLDKFLWQFATEKGKRMTGVETPEDQVRILQSVPLEYQLKNLKDIVRNIPKFNKSIIKLSDAYAQGDIHKIYKLSRKSLGAIRSVMLYDRNERMKNNILHMMKDGKTFIAVGAGHLSGRRGLIRLLRQSGISVNKIA